jgi:hypothetical protein
MALTRSMFVRKYASIRQEENPEWRWGQTIFNVTSDLYPRLADMARGSIRDPFYLDSRVDGFLSWLDRQEGPHATEE